MSTTNAINKNADMSMDHKYALAKEPGTGIINLQLRHSPGIDTCDAVRVAVEASSSSLKLVVPKNEVNALDSLFIL